MIVRLRKTVRSLSLALVGALSACGGGYTEIPIETPIAPKLDVSSFQRVFVAGFLAGASDDVDANLETVRLLRSQLRTKNILRVVDADALPLTEVAQQEGGEGNGAEPAAVPPPAPATQGAAGGEPPPPSALAAERELEQYSRLFLNKDYWKKIGEEYQQPLIVTGSIVFVPHARSGFVQREQETYDSFGRRVVVPVRTYMERKGFILTPTFVFIDGRTGEQLYKESFREEILYNSNQQTPALSSYFELMDRLLPTFLNTLSAQKIRGTRVLLK
jgi:hypothetical protein